MKLRLVKLSLQYIGGYHEFCTSGDYVEFRDGSSSSEIIKHYCSSGRSSILNQSGSIFSTGNSIYVKFKSDAQGPNKKGFRIKYTAIKQGKFFSQFIKVEFEHESLALTQRDVRS